MAFDVRPILWPFTTRPALVFSATQAFCTAYASSIVIPGCWMDNCRIWVRARSESSNRLAASRILFHPTCVCSSESPIIVFFKLPIPSISVTTSSPTFTSARPSGVPVRIMSPGDNVINSLR